MNRREFGFVEGQQQGVLINVQQVLVGSYQQRDVGQRSFGQNQTIVEFTLGNQAFPEQPAYELLANSLRGRVRVKGTVGHGGPHGPGRGTHQQALPEALQGNYPGALQGLSETRFPGFGQGGRLRPIGPLRSQASWIIINKSSTDFP